MPDAPNSLQTLVLNADFRPLSIYPLSTCSWQEAIKALFLGRVDVISEYDTAVHSPSTTLKVPSVVVLKRYIRSFNQTPPLTRYNVLLRDKFTCQYCDDIYQPRLLTLDHVIPRSAGGETSWDNLVAACYDCNVSKSDKLPGREHPWPRHLPHAPTCRELQKNTKIAATYHPPEAWKEYLGL